MPGAFRWAHRRFWLIPMIHQDPEREWTKNRGEHQPKTTKKIPKPKTQPNEQKNPNHPKTDFAFHEKPPQQCCTIQQSTKIAVLGLRRDSKNRQQGLQNASGAHESSKMLYRYRWIKNNLKALLIQPLLVVHTRFYLIFNTSVFQTVVVVCTTAQLLYNWKMKAETNKTY